MKFTIRLAGVALTTLAIACSAITPASIVENFRVDATATSVRMAVERFHDGMRRRDVDVILSSFLPDTTFRAYDGEEGWLTFDNIRLQDVPSFRRLKSVEIAVDSMYIDVLDPSAAVVSNNLREAFTDSAGHVERLRITQTMVWTRRGEGWKIAHIHSSERPDSSK